MLLFVRGPFSFINRYGGQKVAWHDMEIYGSGFNGAPNRFNIKNQLLTKVFNVYFPSFTSFYRQILRPLISVSIASRGTNIDDISNGTRDMLS